MFQDDLEEEEAEDWYSGSSEEEGDGFSLLALKDAVKALEPLGLVLQGECVRAGGFGGQ